MMKKIWMLVLLPLFLQAEKLPLEGRQFGVEFNIPRLLTYSEDWKSASGAFSYFDHTNKVEIAFPWLISKTNDSGERDTYLDVNTIDVHYRKFLGEELNGFYFSGIGRLAHLDGKLREENAYQKTLKFGLGVGLGYRLFPKTNRFYWGTGLVVGRYISSENDIYAHGIDFNFDDQSFFVDLEFLKFGYAF